MLSAKRDKKATKRFLKRPLGSAHNQNPRVITVDKKPAYPSAIDNLKRAQKLPVKTEIRHITVGLLFFLFWLQGVEHP